MIGTNEDHWRWMEKEKLEFVSTKGVSEREREIEKKDEPHEEKEIVGVRTDAQIQI